MPDKRAQHKEIPFSGRLITAEPASIGENFRTLKNMRYTDTHKKGVSGMTKINTTALTTYLKIRNAFHFRKAQPAESHLLVQAYNTGLTASQVLQNATAIPSAGDFSGTVLWPVTGASGAARGYFSDAPDGQMIYANEVDTCIFGGNEIRVGAFVTSAAALATIGASCTSPKDYTDVVNNTKSDSANVAVIGGGNDTYTVLLIHGDSDIADSSVGGGGAPPKTVAAAGGAAYATDQAKFGAGSLKFDGTNDFFYVDSTDPDINDFFMSTGKFTIDFWIYPTSQTNKVFFQQYVDADNYVICGWMSSGSIMRFRVRSGGVTTVDLYFSTSEDFTNRWTHIAVIRGWGGNANDWALCTNGTARATLTDADPWPDLNADFDIGQNSVDTAFFVGWIDEFRVSKGVARWTADSFSSPASPYRAASLTFLIGSPRPASGAKFTVSVANAIANTLTVKEANGSAWVTLTHTDNTDTGGASFAQTGTITWATTVSTSKPLYLEGYYAYWYQFTITAGECEISHVTLDCPFQPLVDTWDGVFRDVTRFFQFTTVYLENTINVLREDYDSATASTYYAIGGLAAFSTPNNCLEVGFTEKQTGIRIGVAVANTTAATDMTVDFWDGTAYTTVGTISDGTKAGGTISLTVTGVVSWNNNSIAGETKKVVSNSPPLYYYRIRFNQAIVAGARIDYIGGITAQRTMSYFKFPVFAQGRVGLCADMSERKNKATWSSKFMPQVYNGADSVDVFYGEDGELTCGTELFSQFGSNLYSLILMFKDTETWVQAGQDIDQWEDNTFLLPGGDGCPAPLTLKTITFSTVVQEQTVTRTMAIWQGTNGIYVSEGRSLVPIHGDIREYFDRQDSRCIKASMIGDSVGFIDYARNEYHWLFASGTAATTLNTELVYDISRNRWFEIDRSADLQCGVAVRDTDGNPYAYGFLDTGYMERLENGNTFDGTAITHTVQFGDMALAGLAVETRVSHVRLITVAKTVTANNVTCTHYADSNATGTEKTMSPARTGYRLAQPFFNEKLNGDPFHSFKFEMTTSDETIGFEPLALVVTHHPVHED